MIKKLLILLIFYSSATVLAADPAYPEWLFSLVLAEDLEQSSVPSPVEPHSLQVFCGATLVKKQWLITAAHCVEGLTEKDVVLLPGNGSSPDNVLHIAKIIVHSSWRDNSLSSDLALLLVSTEIKAQPIDVLSDPEFNALPDLYSANRFVGKPENQSRGSDPSFHQSVPMQILNSSQCKADFLRKWPGNQSNPENINLDHSMFCARNFSTEDAPCFGDSGMPLVVNTKSRSYLVGMVSWSFGCDDIDIHSVFVKIPIFYKWIIQITEQLYLPDQIHFGLVPQGYSVTQRVIVINPSSKPISLHLRESDKPNLQVTENQCEMLIYKGETCSISLSFNGRQVGLNETELWFDELVSNTSRKIEFKANVLRFQGEFALSEGSETVRWFASENWKVEPKPGKFHFISRLNSNSSEAYFLGLLDASGAFVFNTDVADSDWCQTLNNCELESVWLNNRKLLPVLSNQNNTYYRGLLKHDHTDGLVIRLKTNNKPIAHDSLQVTSEDKLKRLTLELELE